MSVAPEHAANHRSVDARGRALPLSAEEARRRAEEGIRALDDVLNMGDAEEQRATLEALERGINAAPLSGRKKFVLQYRSATARASVGRPTCAS